MPWLKIWPATLSLRLLTLPRFRVDWPSFSERWHCPQCGEGMGGGALCHHENINKGIWGGTWGTLSKKGLLYCSSLINKDEGLSQCFTTEWIHIINLESNTENMIFFKYVIQGFVYCKGCIHATLHPSKIFIFTPAVLSHSFHRWTLNCWVAILSSMKLKSHRRMWGIFFPCRAVFLPLAL